MDQSQLQALLEKQLGQRDIYNLVAGVRSQAGHIDLTAGAGVANPDTGTAMTAETPYFLASISKMYTAAVIIKLHQHGLLSLDDAISKLLPATLIAGIHVYKGTDYSAQIRVYPPRPVRRTGDCGHRAAAARPGAEPVVAHRCCRRGLRIIVDRPVRSALDRFDARPCRSAVCASERIGREVAVSRIAGSATAGRCRPCSIWFM